MVILCTKCGERFESLIIDQELAYREVYNASCRHVKTKHSSMFQEMARAVALGVGALTTYMHFTEFVSWEGEKIVDEKVDQAQEIVMVAVGFDPEEEEDEDSENGDVSESEQEGENDDVGVIELPQESDSKVIG